jgi:hypothetical protein
MSQQGRFPLTHFFWRNRETVPCLLTPGMLQFSGKYEMINET